MSEEHQLDEALEQQLPLPLAQLHRRAFNAATSQERHGRAYFLAEAALKLAASLRIGIALQHGCAGPCSAAKSKPFLAVRRRIDLFRPPAANRFLRPPGRKYPAFSGTPCKMRS
jgi:hypothetical protein